MKKNLVIAALSLLTIISVGFAFIQRTEADKARDIAEQQKALAETNQQRAEEQRIIALQSRMEAERQRALAVENERRVIEILKDCQQKRK